MENTHDRGNMLPFIAGTLATLTLLASGVFAIASYVEFLSPIAAIGISLPAILILFALSTAVIALLCKIISLNKKLDVKEAELNEKIKLATDTSLEHQINRLKNGLDGAAKKFEEELSDKIANLREELNKLSNQHSEIVELIDSSIKKDDVEELRKKLDSAAKNFEEGLSAAKEELKRLSSQINSSAKKGETEEKLQMEFYEKDQEREKKTFGDIIFQDVEQKLREICESQKGQDALKKRQGYILCGQPGIGKTTAARVIAYETRSTSAFISVSASSLTDISNMCQVFEKAEKNAPCIVFIDEIDSIGANRPNDFDDGKYSRSLNYLLEKLDGFNPMKGVTVLGATNRPNILDSALTRPGRLSLINFPTLEKEDTCRNILKRDLKDTLKPALLQSLLRNCSHFVGLSIADMNGLIQLAIESKEFELTKFIVKCKKFAKFRKSISSKQYNTMQSNSQVSSTSSDEGYDSRCSSPDQAINDSNVLPMLHIRSSNPLNQV